MKKTGLSLGMFILLAHGISGQQGKGTALYDSKGRLYADTALVISKKQLQKWKSVEDTFTTVILNQLKFPQIELENYISGRVIISFQVDDKGRFDGFNSVSPVFIVNGKDTVKNIIRGFYKECARVLTNNSGCFLKKKFKSTPGKTETYYIPIKFKVDTFSLKTIENHWVIYKEKSYSS